MVTNSYANPCRYVKREIEDPPLPPPEKKVEQSVIKTEKCNGEVQKSPEAQNVADSTVSVVVRTGNYPRYNSEIELSTDTDDSASESSEKHTELYKIEEALKNVDGDIKIKVLELVRNIAKEHENLIRECRDKDNKINVLEYKIADLEKQLSVAGIPPRKNGEIVVMVNGDVEKVDEKEARQSPETTTTCTESEKEENENGSSIIVKTKETKVVKEEVQQTSVIASVEQKAIVMTKAE